MATELDDLSAFVAVACGGGFREAARVSGVSASGLSEALRRLEARLGVRLLHRTTRSISTTEAGTGLFERLSPALNEIDVPVSLDQGWIDAMRALHPHETVYTFWKYWRGTFERKCRAQDRPCPAQPGRGKATGRDRGRHPATRMGKDQRPRALVHRTFKGGCATQPGRERPETPAPPQP